MFTRLICGLLFSKLILNAFKRNLVDDIEKDFREIQKNQLHLSQSQQWLAKGQSEKEVKERIGRTVNNRVSFV